MLGLNCQSEISVLTDTSSYFLVFRALFFTHIYQCSDTNDNSNKFSSLDSREEWEDQTLDAFEGDESNYWNIE